MQQIDQRLKFTHIMSPIGLIKKVFEFICSFRIKSKKLSWILDDFSEKWFKISFV